MHACIFQHEFSIKNLYKSYIQKCYRKKLTMTLKIQFELDTTLLEGNIKWERKVISKELN